MPLDPDRCGYTRRRLQLDPMPLAVVEGERITGVPLVPRQGEARRRIEASGEQADGLRRWSDEYQTPL
jgi:hypothetical protein